MLPYFTTPAGIALLVGLAGSACMALGGFLGSRVSKPADVQLAINAGFGELVDGFRLQIDNLVKRVEEQSQKIISLNQHIIELTATLATHGITAPPRTDAP